MNGKKLLMVLAAVAVVVLILVFMVGCGTSNRAPQTSDYDRAIIRMPDGTLVEGEVDGWHMYDENDTLKIKIGNTTYMTNSVNVVLIAEE